ncbi:recombinase family protein [Bacillus sp. T_4]|nr:recombinase family protein [Bacillus sp. T_4]UYO23116.1 recombinase family protein [Bacillus sp. T_4]
MIGDNFIMNVGIYLRKSRGEDEVQDLAKHREYLIQIAKKNDWKVKLYEEIASSQHYLERPALQQMLKDIEHREIDTILVYAPDRLSRKDVHFLTILDHLLQYGINKIYIKDTEYDLTSPHIRTQLSIMAVLAQAEYMLIAQRMSEGKMRSAEKGRWNGGIIKFGYTTNEENQLVINQEDYPLAREIVDRLLQGFSYHSIAKDFAERGIRTKRGKVWTTASLGDWFNSPTLRGHTSYKIKGKEIFTPNTHRAIVSEAEYQAIKKLQENRENNFKKKKNNVSHWLSGVLTCSVCGWSKKVQIDTKKGNKFYIRKCNSTVENSDGNLIPCPSIGCKSDIVEDMLKDVIEDIREQLKEKMSILLETDITILKAKKEQEVKQLEKELDKLEERNEYLLEDLQDRIITREEFQKGKKRNEEKKENITAKLREAQLQLQEIDVSASYSQYQYIETLLNRWDTLEHEDKNRLIKMVFKRIEYARLKRGQIPDIKVYPNL